MHATGGISQPISVGSSEPGHPAATTRARTLGGGDAQDLDQLEDRPATEGQSIHQLSQTDAINIRHAKVVICNVNLSKRGFK